MDTTTTSPTINATPAAATSPGAQSEPARPVVLSRTAACVRAVEIASATSRSIGVADVTVDGATAIRRDGVALADPIGLEVIVAADVVDTVADPSVWLSKLGRVVRDGARLIAAFVPADTDAVLVAPQRRSHSRELLDALCVRAGWAPPVVVGRAGGFVLFETHRLAGRSVVDVLAAHVQRADSAARATALGDGAAKAVVPAVAREFLLALGNDCLSRRAIDAAEAAFVGANGLAPECARPVVGLAQVAAARGNGPDAEALFDHALGLDAANVDAWRGLAHASERAGENARALAAWGFVHALAPLDVGAALASARHLSESFDRAGALVVLERTMSFGARDAALQAMYGYLAAAGPVATGATIETALGTVSALAS